MSILDNVNNALYKYDPAGLGTIENHLENEYSEIAKYIVQNIYYGVITTRDQIVEALYDLIFEFMFISNLIIDEELINSLNNELINYKPM